MLNSALLAIDSPPAPAPSDPIVGIDLGTTHSLIGAMDAGFPILFPSATGSRLTPSVIYFPLDPVAEPFVGQAAADRRASDPTRTVASIKRLMGRRANELAPAELTDFDYPIVGTDGSGAARVRIDGRDYAPEEISARILRQLKADAERALGTPVRRAVITVPAYFNDAQRLATRTAGELAGLEVERIINEPTAAALAYGLDRLGEKAKIAVYDLGGGTFDISILELNVGLFQVLATNGNTRLGGDDIDAAFTGAEAALLDSLGDKPIKYPPALLREKLREAKVRLSTELETTVTIDHQAHGTLTLQVTRERLEAAARPIVERTRGHCRRALADAHLEPADLDAVILVGGATRMPLVRAFVAELFGKEPDTSQNPDEAVALGATIQAGILAGSVRDVVLLDVTPLSLGIETFGGLANVIIPRNTTIPTKAGELFTNAVAGQRTVRIHVLQGERERAADNWTLGRFDLDFAAGPRGSARVGVQFEIDADGILHVLARDTKTGLEKVVDLRSAVDVSDSRVEAMIADSVEHAFDDYHTRLLVEARLKAAEMLPAVHQALSQAGDALPVGERARITQLAAALESALAADDLDHLRAAVAALDAGTQELATLLIEQAMDAALERRGVI